MKNLLRFQSIQTFTNADIYCGNQYNFAVKSEHFSEGDILDFCIKHGCNIYCRKGNSGKWYIKQIDKDYRYLYRMLTDISYKNIKSYKGVTVRLIEYEYDNNNDNHNHNDNITVEIC